MKRGWLIAVVAIAAMVALRLVALGSDAFPRLDWSAGLLTDEGFYNHNARNVVLYGTARTDEFNNMLLAPLLHLAQVAMFKTFGVGMVQARLLSVICSLVMLPLFFDAMRRSFGVRVAAVATLFLGLDHTSLLYHRMALMDPPAALGAVATFYALVRARESKSGTAWYIAGGILLAITLTNRTLCAYLLPAPFIALWISNRRANRESIRAVAAGFLVAMIVYVVVWYWPNRAEIGPMTTYYRTQQIQPRSLANFFGNLLEGLYGDYRGLCSYLFRHSPVLLGLSVFGAMGVCFGLRYDSSKPKYAEAYLWAWLLTGWAMLMVISYSPSRYYVSTYPAMSACAALTLTRLPHIWWRLQEADWLARLFRTALAWSLTYHVLQSIVHHRDVLPPWPTYFVIYAVPSVVAIVVAFKRGGLNMRLSPSIAPICLALWISINAGWLAGWASGIRYTQQDMSRWLGAHLPKGSVLIGDLAPGLTMENDFKAIHVQAKLVNYEEIVERFRGAPRYITILDGRWREHWWRVNYPELLRRTKRVQFGRVLKWDIGIFEVPEEF